jgi:hypothetical protein
MVGIYLPTFCLKEKIMQILRVGSPNLSYNIPHLKAHTKFYLDGVEFHPPNTDVDHSFIQIPPVKDKFENYTVTEGILLYIDEEESSSTNTRQPRVDANGEPIPSDVKAIESGLKNKLARYQKYIDFTRGKKQVTKLNGEVVTGPLTKKEEKEVTVEEVDYTWEDFLLEVFNVTDPELWLHQEKKATTSQLETPEHTGTRIGISRVL